MRDEKTPRVLPEPVQRYLAALGAPMDDLLEDVAREGRARGLPVVPEDTAMLLHVLAAAIGAHRVLEIGTGIGVSTVWLARAMPADGLLISLERDPECARLARATLARAALSDRVSVMVGDASRLVWKVAGPFDLVFQGGDPLLYEPLLDRLVGLLRPGGMLVTDSVLWGGEVVPAFVPEPRRPPETTAAIGAYNARVAGDRRLATVIVPVGDGIALSVRRREEPR